MLDMVNDQDHPSRVHRTSFDERAQATQTKAIWEVAKGEQLFENYGSANFHNLLFHGFVLEQNSYDTAKMKLPAIAGKVKTLLEMLGVPIEHEISASGDVPISMMADARIRALEDGEVEDALAGRTRRNYGAQLSSQNERLAVKMLLDACEVQIAQNYKTSGIDADVKILQEGGLS